MTVSSQVSNGGGIAAAGATVFPFAYKITDAAHLVVAVNGVIKTNGVDYTLAGVGLSAGGTITFTAPLVGGEAVVHLRSMPFARNNDYQNLGDFRSATVNNDFDALVLMIQQLSARDDRTIRFADTALLPGGFTSQLPPPVPGAALVWNALGTGLVNGDSVNSGDLQLRGNLASHAAGSGSDLVAFPGSAPGFLQTLSDIAQGLEISLHRFIPKAQHAAIRAHTSVFDCGDGIRTAFADPAIRALLIPSGRHNYSGDMFRNGGRGLALRGVSSRHSILRCVGAGGIVFNGGFVPDNTYTMPVLDLSQIRILAAIANAGTAVTMNYDGGSGFAQLGPTWTDVAIEAEAAGHGFQIGCRGRNVRDMHVKRITLAGSNATGIHPATYTMDHGMLMDGLADPVELWIADLYACYLKQAIEVRQQYEGIYIDHAHTVAIHHFLKWASDTPNPVVKVADSYIASERTGIILDRVSYFTIQNNTFNPTAPVPNEYYNGIIIDRSSGDQTQFSDISGNQFIGVGYSSAAGGFTETACWLKNANTVRWYNNDVYDMDVGVTGTAGLGNRLGPNNRYVAVTTNENVPKAMRVGNLNPETVIVASRNATVQNVPNNVLTTIIFDTPTANDRGYYNAATGVADLPEGWYLVTARVRVQAAQGGDFIGIYIRVNGVAKHVGSINVGVAGAQIVEVTGPVYASGPITVAVNNETANNAPASRDVLNQAEATNLTIVAISG